MRYHYEPQETKGKSNGELYSCNHPLYNDCTLWKSGEKGLAVVQKKYNGKLKAMWWGYVDSKLALDIERQDGFKDFLESKAQTADENGLYPTMSVRRIMWALRMKPLIKEPWEFDL